MMMESEQFVRLVAGTVVLAGFVGGWFVHEYFYLLDAFAGLNLLQSSLTGFCPPEIVFKKLK
jgi:hypothetical protein